MLTTKPLPYCKVFVLFFLSSCHNSTNIETTKSETLSYFSKNNEAKLAIKFLFDNYKGRYGLKTQFLTRDGIDKSDEVLNLNLYDYQNYLDSVDVNSSITKIYDSTALDKNFLIQNMNLALMVYENPIVGEKKWYDWKTFCEYVLPYRVGVEVLNNWRPYFYKRYSRYLKTFDIEKLSISNISEILKLELEGTSRYTFWEPQKKFKPSVNQTVDEILKFRTQFSCEDYAVHSTYVLRSLGIPAALEVIPYWGKFNFGHIQEAIMLEDQKFYPNTPRDTMPFLYQIAKMYRKTFSKVKNPTEQMISYGEAYENIPKDFNYDDLIDVTSERTKVSNITFDISQYKSIKTSYLCVYNNGQWMPVDWAKVMDNKVTFKNIGRNILYHMGQYTSTGMKLIKEPFILDAKGNINYPIDNKRNTNKLTIYNWDRNKTLDNGTGYILYSWDINTHSWQSLYEITASETSLQFSLPNETLCGLYKLEPSNQSNFTSVRPFTYKNGEQIWW
ncbi:hypothetical protein [Sphingobacterium sp.]|uniref:hypothetical protein n=1 Tax=Sphingobacterium sp. TaxID=341027 RepID=UPI0028A14FA3|nr:hypothetical protein [Sphingobacterium sp.]